LLTFIGTPHVLAAGTKVRWHTTLIAELVIRLRKAYNRLATSLHNIYGSKAGASAGYSNYSQGITSSGITWDEANLNRFLENPDQVVASNNMKPTRELAMRLCANRSSNS
jgi:hypothetical protein